MDFVKKYLQTIKREREYKDIQQDIVKTNEVSITTMGTSEDATQSTAPKNDLQRDSLLSASRQSPPLSREFVPIPNTSTVSPTERPVTHNSRLDRRGEGIAGAPPRRRSRQPPQHVSHNNRFRDVSPHQAAKEESQLARRTTYPIEYLQNIREIRQAPRGEDSEEDDDDFFGDKHVVDLVPQVYYPN